MLDGIIEEETPPPTRMSNDINTASPTHPPTEPFSPRDSEHQSRAYTWKPVEILNWTMLYWLPGPEASLRWLRRATIDTSPTSSLYTMYCRVPLGVSSFKAKGEDGCPLMWGESSWKLQWVKRHLKPVGVSPAWEAPDLLALDLRECFGRMVADGTISFLVQEG
jgi:hypothetical protein